MRNSVCLFREIRDKKSSGDNLTPLVKKQPYLVYFASFFRTASAGTSPITKGTIQVNNR